MRISSSMIQSSMLGSLQGGYAEYARLDRQIASQKRILQPSDDPVGSVRLLGLKREQAAMTQYQKNIFNAKTQLSQAETQLDTMKNMMMRLRELTQLVANGSVSPEDRVGAATELASLRDGLLDLANARNEAGSSLFAGSQVGKSALVKDPATGAYHYQGDALQRDVPIAKGVTVSLNEGADTLFLSGGDFFKELDDFVTLLESGASDVSTEAGAMLDRSMGVLDSIASMTSRIGAKINLLDQIDESHIEMSTYSKEVSNQIESLDFPAAATRQATVLAALQVQQQAFVKINALSLFDYMR